MNYSLFVDKEHQPRSYTGKCTTIDLEDDYNSVRSDLWDNIYDKMMVHSDYINDITIKTTKGEDRVRGFELISDEQVQEDFKKFPVRKLPKRGTAKSAGYDFFAPYDIQLEAGEIVKVPTGIKAYMQDDEYLGILIRSSLGFKYNLRIVNQEGIIDSDYYNNEGNEGHIFIKIQNEGDETVVINKGEGIAQGIFKKYLLADGDSLDGEERKGGIGSTNE